MLGVLNVISAILQTVVGYCLYWEPAKSLVTITIENILTGPMFLGLASMQLEIRFIFGVLFAARPEDVWTSMAKTRSRVAVALAHFVLAWGLYVSELVQLSPLVATISSLEVSLHALLVILAGGVQAYLITTRLLRTSKKLSTTDTVESRYRLIVMLVVAFVVECTAIAAHSFRATIHKPMDQDTTIVYHLLYQFTIACLGFEAVFQSLSIMAMTNLVAGKINRPSAGVGLVKRISKIVNRRSTLQRSDCVDSDAAPTLKAANNVAETPNATQIETIQSSGLRFTS
nr:hypothetical protein HK105_000909 [Polyrhizophydium stewartii]